MEKTSIQLVHDIVKILDDKKGSAIEVIKVGDLTVLTEYFVICTGTSTTSVKALAGEVEFKMKNDFQVMPLRTEGYQSGNWIIVDYGSVIVHIFHTEMREFYKLERLWADGEKIDVSLITGGEEK